MCLTHKHTSVVYPTPVCCYCCRTRSNTHKKVMSCCLLDGRWVFFLGEGVVLVSAVSWVWCTRNITDAKCETGFAFVVVMEGGSSALPRCFICHHHRQAILVDLRHDKHGHEISRQPLRVFLQPLAACSELDTFAWQLGPRVTRTSFCVVALQRVVLCK